MLWVLKILRVPAGFETVMIRSFVLAASLDERLDAFMKEPSNVHVCLSSEFPHRYHPAILATCVSSA